jgi:hypothetical protein
VKVTGPRDLPDFRLWLLDQWRPGALFWLQATVTRSTTTDENGDVFNIVNTDPNTEQYALPKAALWWVADDMVDLIAHAAATLPETTLTDDLIPDDYGLVVFAHPLVGHQSDAPDPITTDAITWCRGVSRGNEAISLTSYHYLRAGDEMGNSVVGHQTSDKDFWCPTGMADWAFDADTDAVSFEGFNGDQQRIDSMAEDRRWLAALWLLASQPLASSTTEPAYRAAAKRHDRAKIPASSDVRLVNVRRREHRPAAEGEGGDRNYSHRWIVAGAGGDGFWRQQACGPRWSQHRPVWIEPYVAGPEDKPLKVRETVKVVRGD